MNLGLLLIPVLGGYWFLTHWHFTKYSALRESGYHLFFQSAFAGILLGVLAHSIILSLDCGFPKIGTLWKPFVPHVYYGTAILSVVLGFVLPFVLNIFYSQEKAQRRTAKERGELIELIIADSLDRGKLIELSLRSGKVYIGFALRSRMIRRGESDVALIPLASGYRDQETHELVITTNYAPAINEYLDSDPEIPDLIREDFRVVVPASEIVSTRIFSPEIYQRFQQ